MSRSVVIMSRSVVIIFAVLIGLVLIGCFTLDITSYFDGLLRGNEVRSDIAHEATSAIESDPISSSDVNDPLFVLRSRIGESGQLKYRVDAIELGIIRLHGDTGDIIAKLHYEQYYSDGTSDKKSDTINISIEKNDAHWVIDSFSVPL